MAEWFFPYELDTSANPFRDKFGALSADEWCDMLVRSIDTPQIESLDFPRFPSTDLQDGTHGSSGEVALREAALFYKFIAAQGFFARKAVPGTNFLDFGTGWGRIARLFMRDFDLDRIFAFEPRRTSAQRARSLNPYICTLTGSELPDGLLPADRFDLVVGWSVFSHLSKHSATAWLEELAHVMRIDGYCAMSTFGERFLNFLVACDADLRAGKEVHWYHKYCIDIVGDIGEARDRYRRGEFVWIPEAPHSHYGAATFLHENALLDIIDDRDLPFELIAFDKETVNMDVFVLRRS